MLLDEQAQSDQIAVDLIWSLLMLIEQHSKPKP
jgi:hypothetical protein